MSKIYEKSKFIEYLRETPLVSFACKKTGIARATYYRWYKDNREFREQVQEVLRHGRENVNDLAEATLIKMIKNENFNATRFWLQHNKKQYVPVRTVYVPPPKHDHLELRPGETCTYCGTSKPNADPSVVGGGFYEQDIAESKKKFEVEAKKKRKMGGKEKKEKTRKMLARKEAIESYERMGEHFPEFKIFAENLRNGILELPPMLGKPPEYIKKADRNKSPELDLDLE
jgi:hypothetical protein